MGSRIILKDIQQGIAPELIQVPASGDPRLGLPGGTRQTVDAGNHEFTVEPMIENP